MHTHDKQGLFALAVIASAIFGWAMVSTADVQDAAAQFFPINSVVSI